MKKEEFKKELREKLSILEEKEINDIIEEYTGYIDEKIKNGATEEEAIKDFGDIDELATELLKAYKINVEKNKSEKNWINIIVEKINEGMDAIVQFFSNKDAREILRIVLEVCIILIGISFCKLPFHFLEEIGKEVFSILGGGLGRVLYQTWKFIIEIAYFVFAIVLFVKIIEKRYLNNYNEKTETITIIKEEPKSKKPKTESENKEEKKETIILEKKKTGIIDLLANICIWFIKFIAIWILFGIGCYILGMGIVFGVSIYFLVRGVTYFGIYLSILILLVLGILAFILLFNWITNRKNNLKILLISFLVSFVLLGVSFSYASIEIMNTKFIDEHTESYKTTKKEETIPFQNDSILMGDFEYQIDDNLENEIKVTYYYDDSLFDINSDIEYETQNRIYISWDYERNLFWNNKIIDDVIKDLKDHQLHNYNMIPKVVVTTSSKNIEQLKLNKKNYRTKEQEEKDKKNSCRRQLNQYGYDSLSSYCKDLLYPYDEEDDI